MFLLQHITAGSRFTTQWAGGGGGEGGGGGGRGSGFLSCHRLRRTAISKPAGAEVNGPRAQGTAAQLAAVFTPDEVNAKDADRAQVT